jgi:hypothetical protein
LFDIFATASWMPFRCHRAQLARNPTGTGSACVSKKQMDWELDKHTR